MVNLDRVSDIVRSVTSSGTISSEMGLQTTKQKRHGTNRLRYVLIR